MSTAVTPPPREQVERIELTEPQQAYFDALRSGQYRYLAYGGAIRGGKTYCVFMALFMLCKIFPRSRWAVVRKDLPTIKRNVIPAFNKARPKSFVGPINQSTWTAPCANGSEIVFFTESIDEDPDLERWKGLEVNGFVFEEATELQYKSFQKGIERAGAWIIPPADGEPSRQPPPMILLTFNPSSTWVRHVFYDPWKEGRLAAPFFFQPAAPADNPHLTADYRASLEQLDENEYKRFVLGDWDAVSGKFFSAVHLKVHLVPRERVPSPLPDWWAAWSGYDWGFRHNASFGFYVQDGDGNQLCLDTLKMHGLHDAEQAERIAAHAAEIGAQRCLQLTYAGGDVFSAQRAHGTALPVKVSEIFAERGIYCVPAYTARIDGWRTVRSALAWQAHDDGTAKTPPVLRFVDTPGNRWKLETLLACEPDDGKPEDVQKFDAVDGRGGDDAAGELRYALASRAHVQAPTETAPHPLLLNQDTTDLGALFGADETSRPWDDLPPGF